MERSPANPATSPDPDTSILTGRGLFRTTPYAEECPSLAYRPDIDGLRAIAVLAVVAYHAFPHRVEGGFVGVDIFFVISGYLISRILFSQIEEHRFRFSEFYKRRIVRLFPALIAVIATCSAVGWLVLLPHEFAQLGRHVAASSAFVANLALWSEAGYFDNAASGKPLLHLWSLGIEEQFYIVWPILLGLLWKGPARLFRLTLLLAGGSFLYSLHATYTDPVAAYYSPFSRWFELMAGGLSGYSSRHRTGKHNPFPNLQATLGAVLILLALLLVNERRPFPGGWVMLPVGGALLLISAGPRAWLNRTLLSHPVAVGIGLISYPLYLWHWPILSFANILTENSTTGSFRLLLVGISGLLALITHLALEKPVKAVRESAFKPLVAALGLLFLLALPISSGHLPPRNNTGGLDAITTAIGDWEFPRHLEPFRVAGQNFHRTGRGQRTVLLIGDSHLEQYSPRIVNILDASKESQSVVFATFGGCPPLPIGTEIGSKCPDLRRAAMAYATRPEIATIVIGAAWNLYLDANANNPYLLHHAGGSFPLNTPEGVSVALRLLEGYLRSFPADKKRFLLIDNPAGNDFSPAGRLIGNRLAGTLRLSEAFRSVPAKESQLALRHRMIDLARDTGTLVIDPFPVLCTPEGCRTTTANGTPIYKDSGHLRPFFVREAADYLDIILQ
ncbi:MAG: acyltransferase [Magnetococcales bacterium]|nr:acyltransferase [Magnetococcales bacterium]